MDVEALLSALRSGQLPAAMRRWLAAGFERWQQGAELEAALGLASAPLDRRDEALRVALRLAPGASDAAKCAYIVECLAGDREHVSPMAAEVLHKLQSSGVQVPYSIKQLRRILKGSRQAEGTENAVLCPTWSAPQNTSKHEDENNER